MPTYQVEPAVWWGDTALRPTDRESGCSAQERHKVLIYGASGGIGHWAPEPGPLLGCVGGSG